LKICVGLLAGQENQALGSFLNNLTCEIKVYPDLNDFLVRFGEHEVDLLLITLDELTSEKAYQAFREAFSKSKKDVKLYVLSDSIDSVKLPHSGLLNLQDYNCLKRLVEEKRSLFELTGEDKQDHFNEEVIEDIEEEVIDVSFEKVATGLLNLKRAQSIDEAGVALTNALAVSLDPSRRGVFFKYLSTYSSLVALSGFNFKTNKFNGVGLSFSKSKDFKARMHLSKLNQVSAFNEVVHKIFGHENIEIKTLEVDQEVKGVLVFEKPPKGAIDSDLNLICDYAEARIAAIVFKKKYLFNRTNDDLTNCIMREGFFDQLQNEVIRARRVLLPVTVMLLEIDGFYGIKARYNEERVQVLLKSYAAILKKNVRHNDLVGRLGECRFAVIFPHMSTEDGHVKALSLSKLIASTKFFSDMKTKLVCSTSIMIGTYPTQTKSADDLISSLEHLMSQKSGAGAIQTLPVTKGFVKDFEERALPDSSQNRRVDRNV
jgi:diguanylate cyclase (GGDEF)-like protein